MILEGTGLVRRASVVPIMASLLGSSWGGDRAASPGWSVGPVAAGQIAVSGPWLLHPRASWHLRPDREADSLADSAQLETITTDTGAFAPGRRDFTRYTVPALCLIAARDVQRIARRSVVANVAQVEGLDTIAAGQTATMARRCAARFTVAGTATRDLPILFELALYAQNDSLARAVAERWDDPGDAVGLYLDFDFMPAAEAVVAQVDARGPSARREQILMHDQLLVGFELLHDTAGLRREIGRVLILARTLRAYHDQMIARFVRQAYQTDMDFNALAHPDSLPILAEQEQQDLRNYSPVDTVKWNNWENYGHMTTAQLLDRDAPRWYFQQWQHTYPSVPRLHADYVFPPPGGSDTVLPVPGKINLICSGGGIAGDPQYWARANTHAFTESSSYKSDDFWQAKNLRRWLALYGGAGLAVTIVREAVGWAYSSVPHSPSIVYFPSPAAEARAWQWYEQVYDSLPVTVAVQVIHAHRLPLPDERWVEPDTGQFVHAFLTAPYVTSNRLGNFNQCTVIGRDGDQLFQTGQTPTGNPAELDDFLRWLFTRTGTVAGHESSSASAPRQASVSASSSLHPTQDHDQP
jgi:hypothetical protein